MITENYTDTVDEMIPKTEMLLEYNHVISICHFIFLVIFSAILLAFLSNNAHKNPDVWMDATVPM